MIIICGRPKETTRKENKIKYGCGNHKILSSNFQWKFISMSTLCLRQTDSSLHFSFRFAMVCNSVLGRFRSVLFCSQVEALVFLVRDATQSVFHLLERKNQRGKRFWCRSVYIYYMVNIYLFWQTVEQSVKGGNGGEERGSSVRLQLRHERWK